MTKYKFPSLIGLAALAAFMIGGCANSHDAVAHSNIAKTHKHEGGANGYKKPGAAVDYAHDYDGSSQPGDIENIILTLSEPYEAGTLSVEISEDDGLVYYSAARTAQFDMGSSTPHQLDIQIGTPQDGKYYLNFTALTDDGRGQIMRRSFAIAFNVGNGKALELQRSNSVAANGGMIMMDAQETIIVLD